MNKIQRRKGKRRETALSFVWFPAKGIELVATRVTQETGRDNNVWR